MTGVSIYTTWLPPAVAQQAVEEEPRRFAAGVAQLQASVAAARASSSPNRWAALLSPLLDDLKTWVVPAGAAGARAARCMHAGGMSSAPRAA